MSSFNAIMVITLGILCVPRLMAFEMISVEDLLPVREKQSIGIKGKNQNIPTLPSYLSLSEQRRSFEDRHLKFLVGAKSKTIDGSRLGAGFFRYRHLWWTDNRGRLIAEASIRWLRTLRVYDFEGSYLGRVHRLDTGNSKLEDYQLFNRQGTLVARAKQEGRGHTHKELFVEYLNSDESGKRFGNLIAHFKKSLNSSGGASKKKPLAKWQIDIKDGQMDLIGTKKNQLDPRLLVFIGPFSTFWDRGSALD